MQFVGDQSYNDRPVAATKELQTVSTFRSLEHLSGFWVAVMVLTVRVVFIWLVGQLVKCSKASAAWCEPA